MYDLLIKLMFFAALGQLGMSAVELFEFGSGSMRQKLKVETGRILKVDWRPVSIFPEEAKRF